MRMGIVALFSLLLTVPGYGQVWTDLAPMSEGRAGHASAAHGTDLYVFGDWNFTNTAEKFDTLSETWAPIDPMPESCYFASAVTVGDVIHVIGGGETAAVQSFDTVSQIWSISPALPVKLHGTQAVLLGDRIWVLGGAVDLTGPGSTVDTIYRSNDLSVSGGAITGWSSYSPGLPMALVYHQAAVADGVIYVTGGSTNPDHPYAPSDQILSFDPDVGVWETAGTMPFAFSQHGGAMVGAHFFAFGGAMDSAVATSQATAFATPSAAVFPGTSMPRAIYAGSATAIGEKIYVTGGYDDYIYDHTSACRVYDPVADGLQLSFSVGGSVSGLVGAMTLQLNGGEDLVLTAEGPFTFPTPILGATPYEVTVLNEPPGMSSTIVNGSGIMGLEPVSNVSVVCTPDPFVMESILDIPGDQGGRVRLRWDRNIYDRGDAPDPVTGYVIFRRIDVEVETVRTGEETAKVYPPGDWDFVTTVPAFGENSYATIVPTLADSSIAGGMHYSVFFVRATTAVTGLFYDSIPDSGWSVDNLAPSVPTGAMIVNDLLTWDDPVDGDFSHFSIYGSQSDVIDGTEELIGHTTGTSFDVSGTGHGFFLVTASDFGGNEGEAVVLENSVSGVGNTLPSSVALIGNHPNPFNPQTTVVFDLPGAQTVSLSVYEVSGRLVDVIIDNEVAPQGRNEVVWRGRDMAGRVVSAGVYFYRLEAGSYSETKRMVLVK